MASSRGNRDETGARVEDHRHRFLAIEGHIDFVDSSSASQLDLLGEHGFLGLHEQLDVLFEPAGWAELRRGFGLRRQGGQGLLDRVVLGQLGVLRRGRIDELAEVEDRLDIGVLAVVPLPLSIFCFESWVGRPGVEQIEPIVDLVEPRHELVVLNHILLIDGTQLLVEANPFLGSPWTISFWPLDTLFEFVLCSNEGEVQLPEDSWASFSFFWTSDSTGEDVGRARSLQ